MMRSGWLVSQVPSVGTGVEGGVVGVEGAVGELVGAQEGPEVLHRVQFRRVGCRWSGAMSPIAPGTQPWWTVICMARA